MQPHERGSLFQSEKQEARVILLSRDSGFGKANYAQEIISADG